MFGLLKPRWRPIDTLRGIPTKPVRLKAGAAEYVVWPEPPLAPKALAALAFGPKVAAQITHWRPA